MKKYLLLTICLCYLVSISLAQCDVNIIGNDFPWCTPCEGTAFANATGGTDPYTYNWSTSDTTASINNLCAGTYFVEITDDLGCIATDSVTINPIGTPMTLDMTATSASCSTCCDVCIYPNPEGGCPPYNYSWQPNDPTLPLCSACPFETYTVTVVDNCGCSITDSIATDTITVGTTEIPTKIESEIIIFPNPASNFIIVEISNFNSTSTATITDIQGKVIYSTAITSEKTTIKTDQVVAGTYIISIIDNKQNVITKKWIKE
jgi:hypothetical protein